MLPGKGALSLGQDPGGQFDEVRTFGETFPCALSLWNRDRSRCLLNTSAQRLINYSEIDFLQRPSLWMDRIHPDDQQRFVQAQEQLAKRKSSVHCDYRFFPRTADRPLWLREISGLYQEEKKVPWNIVSVYTEVSDLKLTNSPDSQEGNLADSVNLLIHEFRNCIHKINMEVELAGFKGKFDSGNFLNAANSINRSLEDLRFRLSGMTAPGASHSPSAILDSVVRRMRKDLNRRRVNVHVVRRGPLPMVQADDHQLHSAIEQVFHVCGAMLENGGNLEVESGPKELGGELYAEVKLTTHSAVDIESDGDQTFQSLLGGKTGKNRLSIDLAREILSRYRGQVSFRKTSNSESQLRILIKSVSN